jgi:Tol biopolymer transport system component
LLSSPCYYFLSFTQSDKKYDTSNGTIAYIRSGTSIRLISPEGSNDRELWTHKDATPDLGLYDLAWRPDGKMLAFSSGHASASSLFHSDIYTISPDGSGFRKITNAPDREQFSKFPKGSVTITIRNNQYSFQTTQASSGVFTVYIAGADLPQQITLPPGSTKTITFKSVADFGKKAQAVVAIWGNYRWFVPGTDVIAGKTTKAPDMSISGNGIEYFGAFRPVWRSDGSEISYRNGVCLVNSIPSDPPVGEFFRKPMFADKQPMGSCTWDWGPTPATVDQVIYSENSGEESSIYLMKERGKHPGVKLTSFSNIQYQLLLDLHWIPDGSGLLYSVKRLMGDAANVFRYDFKTKQTTQVTKLENEFARNFSVSPDGAWIVYERAPTVDEYKNIDLWTIKIDGTGSKLLKKDAQNPSWGK